MKKCRVYFVLQQYSRIVSKGQSRRLFSGLVGVWAGYGGPRTWFGIKRVGEEAAGERRGVCRELVGCCWCVGEGGRATVAVLCWGVCVPMRCLVCFNVLYFVFL